MAQQLPLARIQYGLKVDQVKKFQAIEAENTRLEKRAAERSLREVMLKEVVKENCQALPDAGRWQKRLMKRFQASGRKACALVGLYIEWCSDIPRNRGMMRH